MPSCFNSLFRVPFRFLSRHLLNVFRFPTFFIPDWEAAATAEFSPLAAVLRPVRFDANIFRGPVPGQQSPAILSVCRLIRFMVHPRRTLSCLCVTLTHFVLAKFITILKFGNVCLRLYTTRPRLWVGLRTGFAVTLALSGSVLDDVMDHVGWERAHTARYYMQLEKVLRHDSTSAFMAAAVDGPQICGGSE